MDLPLSAGRTYTDSSFRKLSSAVCCAFGMFIDVGTLQFLRMFAIETRMVSFADLSFEVRTKLKWPALQQRRKYEKAILTYKYNV